MTNDTTIEGDTARDTYHKPGAPLSPEQSETGAVDREPREFPHNEHPLLDTRNADAVYATKPNIVRSD
jgi:hypothetical protein